MNCVTGIILPSRSVMFRADMKCATPIIKDVSRTRTSPDRTSVRRDTGTGLRVRGFMDFLSYLTLKQSCNWTICIDQPCDYLVMNSVNNLKKALMYLQRYLHIHCYLDNDLAGQKTVETIAGLYGERVSNEAVRYSEYKDLNDCLRGKKR